jgi:UrcA family protein
MLNSDRIAVQVVAVALGAVLTVSPLKIIEAATEGDGALSVTLKYHSTDLETPQGIAGFYRQIRGAASTVCSPFDGAPLAQKQRWNECFNHAVASAVASVQNERLSAYHWHQIRGWKKPSMEESTSLAAR